MKILMLLPQVPHPPNQGARMRNLGLMRILAQRHEVHLLCCAYETPTSADLQTLREFCHQVQFVKAPKRDRLGRAIRLLSSPLPDLAFRLWSPAFAETLRELLAGETFDAVHVSNLEMGVYLPLITGPRRVFDDHNAEYVLQRRAYELGAHGGGAVSSLYSLIQSRRLRDFEARVCRAADLILAVSDEDRRRLVALGLDAEPVLVPNGVDLEVYPKLPLPEDARPFVLFSGKLDYRPNADAARWFVDRILPRVWRSQPRVRLLAVGQAPPGWLIERGKHDVRIVVTGAVPDDRPYLARSSVYVLPMRWGGGVRFKALVAFASGRPLVSTTLGLEGIGCLFGEHALVADDEQAFADAVARALEDRELASSLAQAGRGLVEERFAWSHIAPALLEAYETLAGTAAGRTPSVEEVEVSR